ncbi:MAG: Z1 domain-containing protein [Caldilineaceae bacterium]|nr:Z1 domain-containing protein [Caldilineaceae bacterium]
MSDFEKTRIIALSLLDGDSPPEEADVRRAAEIAVQTMKAQFPGADIDIEALIRELEANLNVVVGPASTLTDDTSDHVPWLPDRRASIEWRFTKRYQRFLKESKGWALATLQRSDDLTDRVMELIEDPDRPGSWDRRGMVVGEVQSGKTSNYIELICKAADAGYKFIVVLTGTTNSLRAQTQLRFDEGFLGWDTRLNLALDMRNKRVGVGTLMGEPLLRAIPSTNAEERGDFNLSIANQFNVRLGGDPVIMVVKKNSSVLRNLTRWARSLSPLGTGETIPSTPILVIDDEADFASVNTRPASSSDDEDPTVINGRIRELLNAFEQSVYIGYTATPFANIFIYPDQDDERHGRDLFPRDFLINLPVPSNHVGPTKVFGLPEGPDDDGPVAPLPLVREVDDHHDQIPNVHRSNWVVRELPDSLTTAVMAFILACAARAARGQEDEHNSMLVHVTRFVAVQNQVAELVRFELRDLQNRIRYGDGDAPHPIIDQLRTMWLEDFEPSSQAVREMYPDLMLGCTNVPWDAVSSKLVESSQRIQVKVINGAAKDALDYWDHAEGLNVIAIGGDKLSRGLTLEGLSVSYYLRTSRMYDTLLQMGRWFGFRPGYVDLCRLYTTDELREFYSHISMATDELRQEFDLMSDKGMTPSEFGLRVRSHSAGLVITAANKMRHGMPMTVSYSGAISETITFDRNPNVNRINHERYSRFVSSLDSPEPLNVGKRIWRGISGEDVADLLMDISVHSGSRKARGNYLAKYIKSQNDIGGLVDWTVALISNQVGARSIELGGWQVFPVQRAFHPPDSIDQDAVYRIRRLVNPSDEGIDLTPDQVDRALQHTRQRYRTKQGGSRHRTDPTEPGGRDLREVRDRRNGLLLIYPLQEVDAEGTPFVGFAASFPTTERDTPVEYFVNYVYWKEETDT